jgi:uncharacterized ParB-like nuclease family protein
MTIPLKYCFHDTFVPQTTTATCVLGAAQYGYAIANEKQEYNLPLDFFDVEFKIKQLYLKNYGKHIVLDNDEIGREKVAMKVKEIINDSQ